MLNKAEQFYVQFHMFAKSPGEMADDINVDEFLIAEYISQTEKDAIVNIHQMLQLSQEVKEKVHYSVIFELLEDNQIDIRMSWPETSDRAYFVDSVSSLLYQMHTGNMRKQLAETVIDCSQKYGEEKLGDKILTQWQELENKQNGQPCILPRDVLK